MGSDPSLTTADTSSSGARLTHNTSGAIDSRSDPDWRAVLLAAAALPALTCAYPWPLVLHVGSAVPHDRGDPLLVTWILWWSTHAVPLTTAWWNAPAFYPSPGVFAFSENLLGLAPI